MIFIGVGMTSAYETLLRTLSTKPHFSYVSCRNGVGEIAKALRWVNKQVRTITESITIQVRTQVAGGAGASSSSAVSPQQLLGMLSSMSITPGGPRQGQASAPRPLLLASPVPSFARPPRVSPARVELLGDPKHKTVMCRHFLKGHCNFGPACKFAHGKREMRQY